MSREVKYDKIIPFEISIDSSRTSPVLQCKAALVSSEDGVTHGSTTNVNWSPETFKRLASLIVSMTNDLEERHFTDGEGTRSDDDPSSAGGFQDGLSPGIREVLNGEPTEV